MLLLHHDQEVAKPAAFEEDLAPVEVSPQERELARTLVEASTATLRASGSKYFGINSKSNSSVAGNASESFNMQGLPAERAATAGRSESKSGLLNGQMTSVTPYGSRYTTPLCPDAARNL